MLWFMGSQRVGHDRVTELNKEVLQLNSKERNSIIFVNGQRL